MEEKVIWFNGRRMGKSSFLKKWQEDDEIYKKVGPVTVKVVVSKESIDKVYADLLKK